MIFIAIDLEKILCFLKGFYLGNKEKMWDLSVACHCIPKHSISNVQCLCRDGRNAAPLWMTLGVEFIICVIIYIKQPGLIANSATC